MSSPAPYNRHEPEGPIDPGIVASGHEPDVGRNVANIVSVPIVIVSTMILCFGVVWGLFTYFTDPSQREPASSPWAEERDKLSLNERLSTVPTRLEDLTKREEGAQMYRTTTATATGNSDEFHPEDIRYDKVPALSDPNFAYKPVQGQPGAVTIPVEQAMKAALEMNLLQKPTDKLVDPDTVPSSLRTPDSNSGRGNSPQGKK